MTNMPFVTTEPSQVSDMPKPIRCRLGLHPWPMTWTPHRITPDIVPGLDGSPQLFGHHWIRRRTCPACKAVQAEHTPLKK